MRCVDASYVRELLEGARIYVRDGELDDLVQLTDSLLPAAERAQAAFPRPLAGPPGVRDPGRRATEADDPLNAVVRWCDVRLPEAQGSLVGKRLGMKDAISVAGVPMTCGSDLLAGFVPDRDAVLVRRVLGEGARIVATLNQDSWLFSSGGETSDYGAVLNPFDRRRTASGSSGGSAAALHYDDVDITFGTDQGGSIRTPASWCGVLGLKPTHGLVPYTGIVSGDASFDHAGPLARTVSDLALALTCVAGAFGGDPRQRGDVPAGDYNAAVASAPPLRDFTVGVLEEGFAEGNAQEPPEGTRETMAAVEECLADLERAGCKVRRVSVPSHLASGDLMLTGLFEGFAATVHSFGNGYHWKGSYDEQLSAFLARHWDDRSCLLPTTAKVALVLGEHFRRTYGGALYGHVQYARQMLSSAYDDVLRECDLILMPTTTHYAMLHDPHASPVDRVLRGWTMVGNTGAADLTGHPALSMPAAEADGLPVGLMAVAPHFGEERLLQFARAWELELGWRPTI